MWSARASTRVELGAVAKGRISRHHMASPARRRRAARSARATSPIEPVSTADGITVESRRSTVLFWGWSSQVPSATTGAGQRSALLGGGGQQAAMCPPPPPAMGSGTHAWGGWAAPDSADKQQRRGSFSRGGRNAKRIPGVGARRRGRRDAALYFSADGSAGAAVPLGTLETSTREPKGGANGGIWRRERQPFAASPPRQPSRRRPRR